MWEHLSHFSIMLSFSLIWPSSFHNFCSSCNSVYRSCEVLSSSSFIWLLVSFTLSVHLGRRGMEVCRYGPGSHSSMRVHGGVYYWHFRGVCRTPDRAQHAVRPNWRPNWSQRLECLDSLPSCSKESTWISVLRQQLENKTHTTRFSSFKVYLLLQLLLPSECQYTVSWQN